MQLQAKDASNLLDARQPNEGEREIEKGSLLGTGRILNLGQQ